MAGQPDWTDQELKAAVKGYLWMLDQEISSVDYSKAKVNRDLRDGVLSARTQASIEYRMQNISAALDELCLPRIKGYVPAKNVGNKVKDRIKRMLIHLGHIDQCDFEPTASADELEVKVSRLRKRTVNGTPRGNASPKSIATTSQTFVRDPLVKAFVLNHANGNCEGCGCDAPFVSTTGDPYFEVHHVLPLAQGGTDTASNAVALCPNCHRRAHFGLDRAVFVQNLYQTVPRLVVERGNT